MFLKAMGALPGYIYAEGDDGVYVNLFVGHPLLCPCQPADRGLSVWPAGG